MHFQYQFQQKRYDEITAIFTLLNQFLHFKRKNNQKCQYFSMETSILVFEVIF